MTATAVASQTSPTPDEAAMNDTGFTAQSRLEEYLLTAEEANPGLKAAYERWMAALEQVAVARGWPDPMVSYTFYLRQVETALGPQEHAIMISQMFPWFGKLSLRGDAAEQAALSEGQRFRQAQLELIAQVAAAYYDYAYLAKAVHITEENLELMRYQEEVARAKYRTDSARYADLVKAQVELGVLEDRLKTLQDKRRPVAARLNQKLGRASEEALPWPVPLDGPVAQVPENEQVLTAALQENPSVMGLQYEIKRQQSLETLARRDRFPDLTFGVRTVFTAESELTSFEDSGRDPWMATVTLNLPLWQGKYGAAIRQAEARERATEYMLDDTRQRLGARVQGVLFEFRDAARKIDLYGDGLVAKAEQSLQSVATAYRAGHASFLDFIDAERTLLAFELELARAQSDRGRLAVELITLMGDLPVEKIDVEGERE
jgi:outer membrane protein TolC